MGHIVRRVELGFGFPVDSKDRSYSVESFEAHRRSCACRRHDKCKWSRWPPEGEGWQLWQDVSDAPVSPVFRSAEALIAWMSDPVPAEKRTTFAPEAYPARPWAQGWRPDTARKLVSGAGWTPSLMALDGRPLSADEAVDALADGRPGAR